MRCPRENPRWSDPSSSNQARVHTAPARSNNVRSSGERWACHLPRGWDHRLATNYGPPVWLIGDDRRSLAWCQLRASGGVGRTGLR